MDRNQNGKRGLGRLPNEIWLMVAQAFAPEPLILFGYDPNFEEKQKQKLEALRCLCLVSKRARAVASIVLYDTINIWHGPDPYIRSRYCLVSMPSSFHLFPI